MKQLFLLAAFALISFGSSAQCSKSTGSKACCAAKKGSASTSSASSDTKVASAIMEADVAMAASNGNITKRTCDASGATSYYQKSVCEHSGSVSWDEVKYDNAEKKFTKVASASMEKDENGKAVDTSVKSSKSCTKSGSKSCCASKKVN